MRSTPASRAAKRPRAAPRCRSDRPAAWTDAHHLEHWAEGGETALSNTVLLCRPHHRRVHD